MNTGIRRPGPGGLSWAVLGVSAILAVAAGGVAKLVGQPDWVAVVVGASAAAVTVLTPAIRSYLEQQKKADAEHRKLTAGAARRDRLVRDYSPMELRVHNSIREDVPYVQRDAEPLIVERINWGRVLIVGPSMAGKTRLALSAAKAAAGDSVMFIPADGKSIHDALAAATQFSDVTLWLDDLERYLGAGGLTAADLTTLYESGSVRVVATIRTSEYAKLQPTGDIKPEGWEVPGWLGDPVWITKWSEAELDRVGETHAGASVQGDARKYGLSNYLGGAPLVQRQLAIGEQQNPEGFGVVRAVSDWRRVGMAASISRSDLIEALPTYVAGKQSINVDDQANSGLAWALQQLNHTVALVVEEATGFRALDLVVDLRGERSLSSLLCKWFGF